VNVLYRCLLLLNIDKKDVKSVKFIQQFVIMCTTVLDKKKNIVFEY